MSNADDILREEWRRGDTLMTADDILRLVNVYREVCAERDQAQRDYRREYANTVHERMRAERAEAALQQLTPSAEERRAAQYLAEYNEGIGATKVVALLRKFVLQEGKEPT